MLRKKFYYMQKAFQDKLFSKKVDIQFNLIVKIRSALFTHICLQIKPYRRLSGHWFNFVRYHSY